jgi:hypothetical protein
MRDPASYPPRLTLCTRVIVLDPSAPSYIRPDAEKLFRKYEMHVRENNGVLQSMTVEIGKTPRTQPKHEREKHSLHGGN